TSKFGKGDEYVITYSPTGAAQSNTMYGATQLFGLDSLGQLRLPLIGQHVLDTANWKPVVADASGNFKRSDGWAGGGGGGFTNPMDAAGQLIYGGASGTATKTATPGHAGMKPIWNGSAVVWGDTTVSPVYTADETTLHQASNVFSLKSISSVITP